MCHLFWEDWGRGRNRQQPSQLSVRGVYLRASKYIQDQRLKLNVGINREMGRHMEARIMTSEMLEKCGVLWSQLAAEIEEFQLHLVMTTYGEGVGASGKSECCTVVITMVRVIWRDLIEVRVESYTFYGSNNPTEMMVQYLWGTL